MEKNIIKAGISQFKQLINSQFEWIDEEDPIAVIPKLIPRYETQNNVKVIKAPK